MKKFKISIGRELKIVAGIFLIGLLIAFSERKHRAVTIQDVEIKLQNIANNHFMDEGDIIGLMETDEDVLRGAELGAIDLNAIEKRIRHDRYVKDAELYNDLRGNLIVRVSLRRPVARVVRSDGPDGYIAEDGTVMPASDRYTSRVTLVSGPYASTLLRMKNISESEDGAAMLRFLNFVHQDEFWKAQLAQLDVDNQTRIAMYPQVGGELIEFGKPLDVELKFKKLKIYYKEILPRMGWNKYKRVNLEYAGQIVAE